MFDRSECEMLQDLMPWVNVRPVSRYFFLQNPKEGSVEEVSEGRLTEFFHKLEFRKGPVKRQVSHFKVLWRTTTDKAWKISSGFLQSAVTAAKEAGRIIKNGPKCEAFVGRIYNLMGGGAFLICQVSLRTKARKLHPKLQGGKK